MKTGSKEDLILFANKSRKRQVAKANTKYVESDCASFVPHRYVYVVQLCRMRCRMRLFDSGRLHR
jgi:hypothetical protein